MDLVNFVIALLFIAIAIQYGELWIVAGATLILIVAAKDVKASVLMIISVFVLYYINGIGLNDYWLGAVVLLIAAGYLIGLGKEQEGGGSPYGDLLGGMGGF